MKQVTLQQVPDKDAPSYMEQVLSSADRNYHVVVEAMNRLMEDVAAVERHRFYRDQGFDSTADWFSTQFGSGYLKACEFVEIAVAVDRLPQLKSAYRSGALSYDHLRALVQIIDEENHQELIEKAEGLSVSHTFKMVRGRKKLASVDSVVARSERHFQKSWDHDRRTLMFCGELPEELGSSFERAIDARAKHIPDDPYLQALGEATPMSVKMADALVELTTTSGSDSSKSAAKPLLVVQVDEATLLDKEEGVAYLEGGPTVAPETVRRLFCDSLVRVMAKRKDGCPVALGSATRIVPERLATQIRYEHSNTCVVAGCRKKAVLEFHHIEHREDGGATEFANIVLMCAAHHHMVHEGGWTLRGSPPKVWLEHPLHRPVKVGPPKLDDETRAEIKAEVDEMTEAMDRAGPEPWKKIWLQKFRR